MKSNAVAALVLIFPKSRATFIDSPTFEIIDFEASMQPGADSYGSTLSAYQFRLHCSAIARKIDTRCAARISSPSRGFGNVSTTACEDDPDVSFRLTFFGKEPGASLELWQMIPGTKTETYYARKRFGRDWLTWSSGVGSQSQEIYVGPQNFNATAQQAPTR